MKLHADENLSGLRSVMGNGKYHPEDFNIYTGMSRSKERSMRESIRKIPLSEFMVSGVAGAEYLIPVKLYDTLFYSAKRFDIVDLISMRIVDGWIGGSLTVDVVRDASLRSHRTGSGGSSPSETGETVQATITPVLFDQNIAITNELVEDANFDLIEWHVSQAGKSMGYQATDLAIDVLLASTDGDGTINSGTTGDVNETKWNAGEGTVDVENAVKDIGHDEFIPNTMLATSEAWMNSLSAGVSRMGWAMLNPAEGYDFKVGMLDIVLNNSPQLHTSTDALGSAFTGCKTVIFDRNNALLTGRKRWLQIENYSNPKDDLSGAVVTARQDSVSIYNDSVYKITEATS